MPKTRKRVPLTSQVSDQLLELLQTDGLVEGDSIPPTGELAERFGVSRTVIREALAELTGRGIISRQQGREGIVAVPGSDQISILLRSRVGTDEFSFAQLHELREILELEAVRLAARRAVLADVASLSDLLYTMRSAQEAQTMLEADVEFHRAVARIANPVFGLVLDGLSPLLLDSRRAAWESYISHGGQLESAIDRHVAIRDAIVDQDESGAVAAMRADLADTQAQLSTLDRSPRTSLPAD